MSLPPPINTSMTPLEWGMLIGLSILWGGSFFFNDVAVSELPTLTVVVTRVTLGSLTLWVVMKFLGQRMPWQWRVWRAFFIMGFVNNVVPFSLIVWGQSHVASGVAAILNATTPLFTVIIAHLMTTDERLTGGRLLGVIIGFFGVVAMIGGDVLDGMSVELMAPVAILCGSTSYAFAGVFGRRFKTLGIPPMASATGQVTTAAVMLIPVAALIDQPWTLPAPSLPTVGALISVGILSTALAYTIYFRILATAGATNLLLVTFLVPVSACLLGITFLGEILLPKHLLGMGLIAIGLAAIDGRPWRALKAGLFRL